MKKRCSLQFPGPSQNFFGHFLLQELANFKDTFFRGCFVVTMIETGDHLPLNTASPSETATLVFWALEAEDRSTTGYFWGEICKFEYLTNRLWSLLFLHFHKGATWITKHDFCFENVAFYVQVPNFIKTGLLVTEIKKDTKHKVPVECTGRGSVTHVSWMARTRQLRFSEIS